MKFLVLIFALSLTTFMYAKQKPNIIIIYVDDMGIGDASFSSGKVRPTPNIDRMAKNGKTFTNYYTNAPVCSPSRVAITTGMYPLRWGINTFLSSKKHNQECEQLDFLKSEAPSLAKVLKSAGYKTGHFGKWHMGGGRNIIAPAITEYGFDEYTSTWESPDPDPLITSTSWIWDPADSIKRWERTQYFVDKTLDFLKRNIDEPCFVNLWPDDVHSPWVASEQYEKGKRSNDYYTLPNLQPVIDVFDKEMGRLMEGIKALGIEKNTLIIFTSDNGPSPTFDQIRTNGRRGCKNSLYEGGINMPFFAVWPGKIKAGQSDEETILSAVDLFPTICSIAKVPLPNKNAFDGEDVSKALFSSKSYKRKDDIYWEYGRKSEKHSSADDKNTSPVLAIRHGNWKCFTSFDGQTIELYNLKSDPNEEDNIALKYPELAEELKKKMLNWFSHAEKSELK